VHAPGVLRLRLELQGIATPGHGFAERALGLAVVAAGEVRAAGDRVARVGGAVELGQEVFQAAPEHLLHQRPMLQQVPDHVSVARALGQEHGELLPGAVQQLADLAHSGLETLGARGQDALELPEEPGGLVGGAAEGTHPGRVHLPLVEVLPQLHRFVEERSHGQVEQDLAVPGVPVFAAARAEQGVAALLQAEQRAAFVTGEQRVHVGESQLAGTVQLEEAPHRVIHGEELPDDTDESRSAGAHRGEHSDPRSECVLICAV
jgi:hypothetical protein